MNGKYHNNNYVSFRMVIDMTKTPAAISQFKEMDKEWQNALDDALIRTLGSKKDTGKSKPPKGARPV